MIITIDGPAGTGKSTVAKGLAEKLGFTYFNTGAIYRSLTWYLLQHEIDSEDEEKVHHALVEFRAEFHYDEKSQKYFLGTTDITDHLRSQEVTNEVSQVAQHAYVRDQMMPIQRDFAKHCKNTVYEGRDTGSVVFPHAELKIFLTASPEVRARRRLKDFVKQGDKVDFDDVLQAIKERDHRDTTREVAPLRKADDAVTVDTDELTITQVIDKIADIYKEKSA